MTGTHASQQCVWQPWESANHDLSKHITMRSNIERVSGRSEEGGGQRVSQGGRSALDIHNTLDIFALRARWMLASSTA